MSREAVALEQWAEVLKMIEATRPTTSHPDAHACMDALKQIAQAHTELLKSLPKKE